MESSRRWRNGEFSQVERWRVLASGEMESSRNWRDGEFSQVERWRVLASVEMESSRNWRGREISEEKIQRLMPYLAAILKRSEELKKYLRKRRMNSMNGTSGEFSDREDSKEEDDLSDLLQRFIISEKSEVKWWDVVGLLNAKAILTEAFLMPLKFPYLFTGKRRPWDSVLLYGPPGTGKTLLSLALATIVDDSTFIVLSKCLGESQKLFKNLLRNRKTQAPIIVFIDEIDVLFSLESARRTKLELLTYMQDPFNERNLILILATASQPWLLDEALLKRFEKKIYIPLPNMTERHKIFEFGLGNIAHQLTLENLQELAKKTENYSGGDISSLVQVASMQPIKKIREATHFKRVYGPSPSDPNVLVSDLLTPCPPNYPQAIQIFFEEIPRDKLLKPMIGMNDMLFALAHSKPSVDKYNLSRYKRFQEFH